MKDFKFTEENIYSLWQNEFYNGVRLVFYRLVNQYLWTGKIKIDNTILEKMKISKKDLEMFIKKYINKMTDLLYLKPKKKNILYRGEIRDNFNFMIGDVLIYNNFHSTTNNISFALKFSELYNKTSNTTIIFSFEIPEGFYYNKLSKTLVHYNKEFNTTYYINEYEFLIPPNAYYRITNVFDLPRKIKIVKAVLVLQDKFLSTNDLLYVNKELKYDIIEDFDDPSTDKFIEELYRFDKMIEVLNRMNKYHIDDDIYLILRNNSKIFKYDTEKIQYIATSTNIDNYKENIESFKKLGFDYYNKKIYEDINAYIKGIQYFGYYNLHNFKYIDNFKLYMGVENVYNNLNEPTIIKRFKSEKIGIIDRILYCELSPDCYLYNCPYNDYKPNITIEKNKIKTTQYIKSIIEFELFNVKIGISNKIKLKNETEILVIPNFKYIIKKIESNKNKFNEPIDIYYIDLIGL